MALAIHNCADLPHMDSQVKEMKPDVYTMAIIAYPRLSIGQGLHREGYADNCVLCGTIDPRDMCAGARRRWKRSPWTCATSLNSTMRSRLKSKYCIASNCEVPPGVSTKLENIKAQVDAVKKYGQVVCK